MRKDAIIITATFDGEELSLTPNMWVKYLATRSAEEHISANAMRQRLKRKQRGKNITYEQVLGIKVDECRHNAWQKRDKPYQMVHKSEQALYEVVNRYLRRRLL